MRKSIFSAVMISATTIGLYATNPMLKNQKLAPSKMFMDNSDRVIGVGVNLNFIKLFGGNPSLFGFGANALYSKKGDKNSFFGDFAYYLPGTKKGTTYGNSNSSLISPSQIEVDVTTKISGIGARVGYRRYFMKEISEDGFNIYGQLYAGIMIFNGKNTLGTYDTKYSVQLEPTSSASGFIIGGGLGMEYSISSKLHIFAEPNFSFPASAYNSRDGFVEEIQVPPSVSLNAGVRFHF
jgi:hypothetical protein